MDDSKKIVSDENNFSEKITQLEDLQKLIQLDMINLKSEIDRMKMMTPSPIPIETEKKIMELEKIADDINTFRNWKKTVAEVKVLREKIMALKGIEQGSMDEFLKRTESIGTSGNIMAEIRNLRNEVEKMKDDIYNASNPPPAHPGSVRSRIMEPGDAKKLGESLERMRRMLMARIEEMDIKINSLKETSQQPPSPGQVPLRKRVLGDENGRLAQSIENTRRMLLGRIEEIERKMHDVREIDIRGAVRKMREEIENLKKSISERDADFPEKNDGSVQEKINDLEKRIDYVRNEMDKFKMKKIDDTRPIIYPTGGSEQNINNVKHKIEGILNRLDKDESFMRNVFRDKQETVPKPPPVLMSDKGITMEIDEIKRDVQQTEDQVMSVINDMKQIRKGLEMAERGGMVKRKYEIEDVKKRIGVIEKRLELLHIAEPIVIE